MGFKLYENKTDRIRFISTCDSSVVRETPDQIAAADKYLDTLDESLLTLRDKPFIWVLRPLTAVVLNTARRNANASAYGNFVDLPTATELFRLCLEGIENWPKDYPQLDDHWVMEGGEKVVSRALVARIPTPVIHEASHVLMASLFASMPNEPRGKGEVQKEASPKN